MSTRRDFLAGSAALVGSVLAGCRPGPGVATRLAVPEAAAPDRLAHVLARCSFGPRPGDRAAVLALDPDPDRAVRLWLERQLAPEAIPDPRGERTARRFPALSLPAAEMYEFHEEVLLADLTSAALLRAVVSERQLFEVMVGFWSDHFNIDATKGECAWLKAADDRDVVRRHALGRFPELLRASALSPAMLWYLDGRVNRRSAPDERPNENYARELLELHTLGVDGGYDQTDVMEVARCLTGWTVRPRDGFGKARVEFRPDLHDDGPKRVLGHEIPAGLGEGDLEQVLRIAARHPSTARHLARKLCRRFVAEEPPAAAVRAVARAFEGSGGDVRVSLRALFGCPEFLEDGSVRGRLFKRPFHLVASALRATGAQTDGRGALAEHLHAMGQAPFQFPTPDGPPVDAAAWRDALLPRWRFATDLAQNRLDGTRLDLNALQQRAGGEEALMAHVMGRAPSAAERAAWDRVGGGAAGLAVALGSPAFQRF